MLPPIDQTYAAAIFWILFIVAIGLFAGRARFLYRSIRLGREDQRFTGTPPKIKAALVEVVTQRPVFKNVTSQNLIGIEHVALVWGLAIFLTLYMIFQVFGPGFGLIDKPGGSTPETVYFTIMDIAAIAVIFALGAVFAKRYVIRPERLTDSTRTAGVVLPLLLGAMLLLMVLYCLMAGFAHAAYGAPDSPIGSAIGGLFDNHSADTLEGIYKGLWWAIYALILGFMIYTLRSKHLHPIMGTMNLAFKSPDPKGALQKVDIRPDKPFGATGIQNFTWKQLLDLYACTECGRCHVSCPAQISGKALSPREIILHLQKHLLRTAPGILGGKDDTAALVGEVVTEEEIWACTTCGACQQQCPVSIEHISKIIDMRRGQVLEEGKLPEAAETALRSIADRGHPWPGTGLTRTDWADGLQIKTLAAEPQIEVLYWVGCASALDEQSKRIAVATGKVLKAAGINFGILGGEELCCGDPARRIGDEYLFQSLAQRNIETLNRYGVKKIVCSCPHCFNTLKNEYPQFGGNFEVWHHSEFIHDLINQGKLTLTGELGRKVTYHDACYLGRYNDIYQAPREILGSIPGAQMIEMERNRENGFCCGGGGGAMWTEETTGERINHIRTKEALNSGAELVATACPFCLQMFADGATSLEEGGRLEVKDLAEIVAESLG